MKRERQEFSTKKHFIQWIRETLEAIRSGADRNVVLFVGYDPVPWRLWASLAPQTDAPDWSYRSYPIPKTMAEARQIWDTTHEEYLCLFFQLELYVQPIVVAVRQGVWRSIDDTYLSRRKCEFREITDQEAEQLVGESETWSAMCGEVQMFGISCRLVHRRSK